MRSLRPGDSPVCILTIQLVFGPVGWVAMNVRADLVQRCLGANDVLVVTGLPFERGFAVAVARSCDGCFVAVDDSMQRAALQRCELVCVRGL